MCMVQLWSVGYECIIYDCVCIKVADEDNPELIEKIENAIQNYFWSGAGMIEVRKYLT